MYSKPKKNLVRIFGLFFALNICLHSNVFSNAKLKWIIFSKVHLLFLFWQIFFIIIFSHKFKVKMWPVALVKLFCWKGQIVQREHFIEVVFYNVTFFCVSFSGNLSYFVYEYFNLFCNWNRFAVDYQEDWNCHLVSTLYFCTYSLE